MARITPPFLAAALFLGSCTPAPDAAELPKTSDRVKELPAAAAAGPGQPAAAGTVSKKTAAGPDGLPAGSLYRNPANGRDEVIVEGIQNTAVLIGDSQSEPSMSWPRLALRKLGYNVVFCGGSGTGFVVGNGARGSYIDALENGEWHLPYGAPPVVVIEGGGNDATRGASDFDIEEHAERLIDAVEERYPAAEVVMVGTLARGAQAGGGRRTQVDSLLGSVAKEYGLSFVSVGDWLTRYGLDRYLADDRHLNAEGNEAAAALLSKRLEALGLV
ncbi:SGNH/GDSL hydrolase family protein [Arthrobacter sp. C9C5]|nr:SGNH/GDSL hydrolase family protein [Arthrobacter sp. C9C5]NUU30510.1 SGNH/GDSL hydrolase family protein [Arthrobacter sp. C9C5]